MTTIAAESIRYPKPKILLVDLPDTLTESLTAKGYNALAGTFGQPYEVEQSEEYIRVVAEASLPNYAEQEIVVVDLTRPDVTEPPTTLMATSYGKPDCYARATNGLIDPRPRIMIEVRDEFDRIVNAGGCFVVFAAPRVRQELVVATARKYWSHLDASKPLRADNWSFLSVLSDNLDIKCEHGTEMSVTKGSGLFFFLCSSTPRRRHVWGHYGERQRRLHSISHDRYARCRCRNHPAKGQPTRADTDPSAVQEQGSSSRGPAQERPSGNLCTLVPGS